MDWVENLPSASVGQTTLTTFDKSKVRTPPPSPLILWDRPCHGLYLHRIHFETWCVRVCPDILGGRCGPRKCDGHVTVHRLASDLVLCWSPPLLHCSLVNRHVARIREVKDHTGGGGSYYQSLLNLKEQVSHAHICNPAHKHTYV